ncbi:MAG: TfoX/Sxy family protein [Thermoleophilia bacterium]
MLLTHTAFEERRMFGGFAFMVGGHMACGIVDDEVMVRLGAEGTAEALGRPGIRQMDFTGRPTATMVFLTPAATQDDGFLQTWVSRALAFTEGLPDK